MSDTQNFELLSDATNAVVARYVGRNFPGVLIQGDTLKNLFNDVEELREEISNGDLDSAIETADVLREKLHGFLIHYEKTLAKYNVELPYFESVSSSQL